MTAVVAAATCCGSVAVAASCGASLVAAAAALPAACGALDERRLVGTAASDLSTLADARGGKVGATLQT
jgi:hypothetical protein